MLFIIGSLLPYPVAGQEPIDGPIRFRTLSTSGELEVEIGNLFDDEIHGVLDEGFPVRVQLSVALWHDGFFDDRVGTAEWRATARRDGEPGSYRLDVASGGESQRVRGFEALQSALGREIDVPLRPAVPGRYYYQLTLSVESLSADDLDELEQWLRGETTEEASDDDRGTLGRGVQRLFVRALGLPARRLQRRTRPFEWDGGSSSRSSGTGGGVAGTVARSGWG